MNLQYISGFLDADGSITISKSHKNAMFKTIKIDFCNNELNILENIQTYFKDKHDIKLFISKKPSKKLTHSDSYTLSCSSNQKCITICNLLESIHPKKLHRINTILKYHNKVTKRNGKYSNKEITRKLAYERLFFSTNFH